MRGSLDGTWDVGSGVSYSLVVIGLSGSLFVPEAGGYFGRRCFRLREA